VLTATLLLGTVAPVTAEEATQKPLPVTRTSVLRDEGTYVVDGRQTIPPGVEITGQKGMRIVGKNGAVLEVRGALVVHGISGKEVVISGVKIEPWESVQQLHLDNCKLEGSSVATPEGKTTSGMITLENCNFNSSNGINLSVTKGKVLVMSVLGNAKVRLVGVDLPSGPNKVEAMVYGCKLTGALEVELIHDLVVRSTLLEGSPMLLKGNRTLLFDSNRVQDGTLVLEQPLAGAFKGTTFTKCDLYVSALRIFAPAEPGKSDAVTLDKCWFQVGTDADAIAKVVEDAADDPKNGVKVRVKNPQERPYDFVKDD